MDSYFTANGLVQTALYLVALVALGYPLGRTMAKLYDNQPVLLSRVLGPIERLFYRLAGIDATKEMNWQQYALAVMMTASAPTPPVKASIRRSTSSLRWSASSAPDTDARSTVCGSRSIPTTRQPEA